MSREAVVAEARTWLGTPYHHDARVKGHGVDCAQFILWTFSNAGIIEPRVIEGYTHDWHLHRNEEAYLAIVEEYLDAVDDLELSFEERQDVVLRPADVLVFRVGRTYSHGAIVTGGSRVIHSYFPSRIVEEVELQGTPMAQRPMKIYTWRDQ